MTTTEATEWESRRDRNEARYLAALAAEDFPAVMWVPALINDVPSAISADGAIIYYPEYNGHAPMSDVGASLTVRIDLAFEPEPEFTPAQHAAVEWMRAHPYSAGQFGLGQWLDAAVQATTGTDMRLVFFARTPAEIDAAGLRRWLGRNDHTGAPALPEVARAVAVSEAAHQVRRARVLARLSPEMGALICARAEIAAAAINGRGREAVVEALSSARGQMDAQEKARNALGKASRK